MNDKFSEDYLDGYEAGLAFMLKGEREHQRLAAFGAIRRAAEVARHWQDDQEEICGEAAAFYIRQAIRAAIRSPKV